MLGRVVGAVQWIVGVAAATCVVMLFTLGGTDDLTAGSDGGYADGGSGEGSTDPAVLEAGRELYASQCAVCHGADGQGGTGPRLAGTVVTLYPDVADQITVVADGRNGMRGFADRLTADEIAAIVAFTREGF